MATGNGLLVGNGNPLPRWSGTAVDGAADVKPNSKAGFDSPPVTDFALARVLQAMINRAFHKRGGDCMN